MSVGDAGRLPGSRVHTVMTIVDHYELIQWQRAISQIQCRTLGDMFECGSWPHGNTAVLQDGNTRSHFPSSVWKGSSNALSLITIGNVLSLSLIVTGRTDGNSKWSEEAQWL